MPVEETNTAFAITPVKTVTKEKVIELLREVVAEFGEDYLYKIPDGCDGHDGRCLYVHTDDVGNRCPGCIVGQVLHRLGVPFDFFTNREGVEVWGILPELEGQGWKFTIDASKALEAAQAVQDKATDSFATPGDYTWGAALRAAEETK